MCITSGPSCLIIRVNMILCQFSKIRCAVCFPVEEVLLSDSGQEFSASVCTWYSKFTAFGYLKTSLWFQQDSTKKKKKKKADWILHLPHVFTAFADHNGLSPRQIKSDSDDDDLPNVTLDSVNETGSTALSIARAVQEWVSQSIQPSDYWPCQCTTVLGAKHNTNTKCKKARSWCSSKTIAVQGAGSCINFSRTYRMASAWSQQDWWV